MRKRLKRGLFITFEGPEGVGKSTQAALLADRLREDYVGVILTREPGGTALGSKIRQLTHHAEEPLADTTELLLMAADRAQHVAELVRPALEEGQIVISDRYIDSSIVYQGWGRGHSFEHIRELHRIATGNLFPHATFIMEGKPFRERGDDRFERLGDEFHNEVRRGYWHLAHDPIFSGSYAPQRFHTVAAERPREAIAEEIYGLVELLLVQRL